MKFPKHVRISAFEFWKEENPPLLDINGKQIYVFEGKFIGLLADALNFSFTYVPPRYPGNDYMLPDGNWTGNIDNLQRGAADIGIGLIGFNEDRAKVIDFSFPYIITDVTFLTNKPEELSKSFAIFYPFSSAVWIALLASFIFLSIFYYIIDKHIHYAKALFIMFGIFLEKSFTQKCNSRCQKCLVLLWVVGSMILTYSYKATLLSFLSFPSTQGVRDITELYHAVTKGTHTCTSFLGENFSIVLLKSTDNFMRVIGQCLRNSRKVNTLAGPDQFLTNFKGAYIGDRNYLTLFKDRHFLSEDSFFQVMYTVGTSKSFCCMHELEKAIRRLFETGHCQKAMIENYRLMYQEPKRENVEMEEGHKLSLNDLLGALILLVFGHITACITLIFERYIIK